MSTDSALAHAPEAHHYTVRDLVLDARRGRIRVPHFQRDFKWSPEDVRKLFDSLYRGYPVGSLLLWRRTEVPEGPTRIGPVSITSPDRTNVRWLVDGQQRVTALTAALTEDRSPDRRFDLYFALDSMSFEIPDSRGPRESWVPVHRLFDAADLGEFLLDWPPGLSNRAWRRALLEVGKRLREYPVPAYTIESDDVSVLREIFRRTNRSGKQLTEPEVFNALDRTMRNDQRPLDYVSDRLSELGWGDFSEETLLAAVLVNEGMDPTRKIDQQIRADSALRSRLDGSAERLLPGLERAVLFLINDAHIPHQRLLPYTTPLIALPALLQRHPHLSARQRRLLVRWVWRGFMSKFHEPQNRVGVRQAARLVIDESKAPDALIGALLHPVPSNTPTWSIQDDQRYNASYAMQRVGLLGLALLGPRGVSSAEELDVSELLTEEGTGGVQALFKTPIPYRSTLANRALHRPHSTLTDDLRSLAGASPRHPTLASHAINEEAASALAAGDDVAFLEVRARTIEQVVAQLASIHAEWDADDSSSLRTLLKRAT